MNRNRTALTALLFAACAPPPAPPQGPSVLLISIDSLRADHLGCYGYERPTSPRIDRLAAEGTLFLKTTSSSSWTLPAHAALFTGLPDSVHGCDRSEHLLVPERATLAESLQDAGYRTAGFWSGPYLHPRFGLAQGFGTYVACAGFEYFADRQDLGAGGATTRVQARAHRQSHEDITGPRLVEEAGAWLRANADEPFFLFVHMWDVHYDFIPPAPHDTQFTDPAYDGPMDGRNLGSDPRLRKPLAPRDTQHLIDLYDGEIAWTDRHVGKLLDLLDELEVADDTLVVLTSDHGEEFFEHRRFGHRKTLYAESVDIPLILRLPGGVPAGEVRAGLARIVDVAPTVLELCGVDALPDVMGRSLVPDLEQREQGASYAVSELFRARREDRIVSVETLQWKVIQEEEGGRVLGLFDKQADPGEQDDLSGTESPLEQEALRALDRVRKTLWGLRGKHPSVDASSAGPMSPELERQLRAMGYLGSDED